MKNLKLIDGYTKIGRGLVKEIKARPSPPINETEGSRDPGTKHLPASITGKEMQCNAQKTDLKNTDGPIEAQITGQNINLVIEPPVVQSGTGLGSIEVNNGRFTFLHTCAFDSIFEILLAAYCGSKLFRIFDSPQR